MGKHTNISWTSATWNPVQGCHKISEGCKNCYMFSDKKRYGQDGNNVHRSTLATFNKPLIWHKKLTGNEPFEERLVFTASWSDWFIEENDAHRADMWQIVRDTPNLTYQILTKRADRIKECLPDDWGKGYENVWLGVSVENQKRANERIPLLLDVPAKIRFLSCEPLLQGVDLDWCPNEFQSTIHRPLTGFTLHQNWNFLPDVGYTVSSSPKIDWVIVGGESGNGARPCDISWIRSIVTECESANVACFVKQFGANVTAWGEPVLFKDKKGGDISEFPEDLQVRQFPEGAQK